MPIFSVIIPVYNVEDYLPACIDSVLEQKTPVDYEIVLVNDGSADRSGAICDEYAAAHDHILVIHSENRGVSHARNLGISAARGEYVLFMDSDDLWEKNVFSTLEPLMQNRPDAVVYGYRRLLENGTWIKGKKIIIPNADGSGMDYLNQVFAARTTPLFAVWGYAFKRSFLLEKQITFDETMKVSEDFDFIMAGLTVAGSVTGTDEPLYVYRERGGSATASISLGKLMDNLRSKAKYYRLLPVTSMADLYATNALLVARMPRREAEPALEFLRENRDIWNHVSETSLKVCRILVRLLGDDAGVRVHAAIRKLVRG